MSNLIINICYHCQNSALGWTETKHVSIELGGTSKAKETCEFLSRATAGWAMYSRYFFTHIIQNYLYQSDFDHLVANTKENKIEQATVISNIPKNTEWFLHNSFAQKEVPMIDSPELLFPMDTFYFRISYYDH